MIGWAGNILWSYPSLFSGVWDPMISPHPVPWELCKTLWHSHLYQHCTSSAFVFLHCSGENNVVANINVLPPHKKVYCFRYASGDRGEMVSRNSTPRGFSLSRLTRAGQHQYTLASHNSNWPDLTQHLVVRFLLKYLHHEVSSPWSIFITFEGVC